MQRLDLPHTVFLGIFVLVGPPSPHCADLCSTPAWITARHRALADTPIQSDRDHWLQLHMIEYLPVLKLWKAGMQVSTHAILSYVHAAPGNLDSAILGKQVCGLIPLTFVDIIAIGIFEIGQGNEIFEPADSAFKFFDLRLQLL